MGYYGMYPRKWEGNYLRNYPPSMDQRLGWKNKLAISSVFQKLNEEQLDVAKTLNNQIRANHSDHVLSKKTAKQLFIKQQRYFEKVVDNMPVRKELEYFKEMLMKMIITIMTMLCAATKNHAEKRIKEIEPIQTSLNNLWDLTKDDTIQKMFKVYCQDFKIPMRKLCERLGIHENDYQYRQETNEIKPKSKRRDYRKEVEENLEAYQNAVYAVLGGDIETMFGLVTQGMEFPLSRPNHNQLGPNPSFND